jgi:hypothetical protein
LVKASSGLSVVVRSVVVVAITPAPDTAPAAVLGSVRDLLLGVWERLPAGWSDDELLEGMSAVQRARGVLDALEASMLAEVDVRELPRKRLQWGSTADWFTHLTGGFKRDGRRKVRHARLLTSDYAATLEAVRDGATSMPQAATICDAVETLPTNPALRAEAEQVLLKDSRTLTATELARAGRHIAAVVDPDGEERAVEAALDREERAAHLNRHFSVVPDGAGGVRLKGYGSVEDGEVLRAALLPQTKPQPAADPDDPTCETEKDPRDHGARMWDALVATAQHSLDTELPPDSHGTVPRVVVTTTLDNLQQRLGQAAWTETGLDLSVAAVRRLACDAQVIPGVLGADGQVLDVGRAQRLVTMAIWIALILRDRHCAFPGCTRPPSMCHAHHITHWADGGPTSLANLVLLCGEHHRAIHHTPWQVRLALDGGPEFLPPPRHRTQTEQTWIRHRPRRE